MHLISVLNTMQHHLANMKTDSSLHDYLGVRCKTFINAFLFAIKVDGFFSRNILSPTTRRYPSTTTTHASNACSTSRHGSAATAYNTGDHRSTRTSAASSTHGHGSCTSSPAVSPSGHGSTTASSSGAVARRAHPDGNHGPPSSRVPWRGARNPAALKARPPPVTRAPLPSMIPVYINRSGNSCTCELRSSA